MSSKSEIRHNARGKGDTGCANTPHTYPIYLLRKNVTFSESNKFCTNMWSVFLTSKNYFSIISEKGKTINMDDILVFGKYWIIFVRKIFNEKQAKTRFFKQAKSIFSDKKNGPLQKTYFSSRKKTINKPQKISNV